jgi:hypothetical protein
MQRDLLQPLRNSGIRSERRSTCDMRYCGLLSGASPDHSGAGPLIAGIAIPVTGADGGVERVLVAPAMTTSLFTTFAPRCGTRDALSAPTATAALPPRLAAVNFTLRRFIDLIYIPVFRTTLGHACIRVNSRRL